MVPGNLGSGAAVLAATTTSQPSAARRSAITLPTPREAPVTTATLFANRIPPVYTLRPLARGGCPWEHGPMTSAAPVPVESSQPTPPTPPPSPAGRAAGSAEALVRELF